MSLSSFVSRQIGPVLPPGYEISTVSVRLPSHKVSQLDFVAKHLGTSRQSLLSAIIDDGLYQVVELISETLGENEGGSASDRFMAEFSELIPYGADFDECS